MKNTSFLRIALAACGAVAVFTSAAESAAREAHTFVIAAAGGYGVEDCLAEGGECGQVVADAWCASQGRGSAVRFGRSEHGPAATGFSADASPYFITCQ